MADTPIEKLAPTVSVVIPCYNHGAFIGEAIASVRNQTYTDHEIIVVDDGSNDPATVRLFDSNSFPDTRIIRTENRGPSCARNTGIANARGRYILPLDADDLIEPTYLAKAVFVLDSRNNVGIVYCKGVYFGERTGDWGLPDYSLDAMLENNTIFVTALFRRDDWDKVGGFKDDMKAGFEDYDFWLSIIELGRDVYQIPERLFHYRKHSRKASRYGRIGFEQQCACYNAIYRRHRELYRANIDVLFRTIDTLQKEIIRLREKTDKRLHIQLKRLLKKMRRGS